MKKFVLTFTIVFSLFTSPYCVSNADENNPDTISWESIDEYTYIDIEGITGTENYYGYNFLIKAYNKGQFERIYDKDIEYTITQYSINCLKHKYKMGVIDSYDKDNNFINGDYNQQGGFQPIIPGSSVGIVFDALCYI